MAKIITSLTSNLTTNSEVLQAFATERKTKALQLIAHYLQKKPSHAKKTFFEVLKQRIDKDGFDYYILSNVLHQIKPSQLPLLFKHWEGAEASGAAECMQQLWSVATGQLLNDRAVTAMVEKGKLPTVSFDHTFKSMKDRIEKILGCPLKYPESAVKQAILRECIKAKESGEAPKVKAQDERAHNQREAERRYRKVIFDKAVAIIGAPQQDQLFFDPQGRVLVEVPVLEENELLEISQNNDAVMKALKVSHTGKSTICDIDILSLPQGGKEQFLEWIMAGVTLPVHATLKPTIEKSILNGKRSLSSFIPLQKEMTFYLLHTARVLRSKMGTLEDATMSGLMESALDDELAAPSAAVWSHIIQHVNAQVNVLVRNIYARALQESLQNGAINLALLNQKLDAARAQLAPQCEEFLMKACLKWLPRKQLSKALQALKKEDFKHATATGKDYLRSDGRNHIINRAVGTEKTSRNKTYGDEQAFRLISTMRYDAASGEITPLSEEIYVRGRVPSIVVLNNSDKKTNKIMRFFKRIFKVFSHSESVVDAAQKLDVSYSAISEQLGGYQGPMVYNLHTSLNSKLWDFFVDWGNHQRASAARILKAAHLANAGKIKKGFGFSDGLWYVQNIPVNQHTNSLSYDAYDDARREATLMTDIALLSTFAQHAKRFPDNWGIKENYFQVHEIYKQFLTAGPQGDIYFSDTLAGQMVMERLTQFKQSLTQVVLQPAETSTMVDLATKALLRLYSNNSHWDKQFGMLVQSLSVFVEKASQGGCKSAIDRFEGVEGRVLLLESILPSEVSENELARALTRFVTAERSDPGMLEQTVQQVQRRAQKKGAEEALQKGVDTAYDNTMLYPHAISLEDNGGGSKLRASKSGNGSLKVVEWNTNIGESGHLKMFPQNNPTQSHQSGVAKRLKKLFQKQEALVPYEELLLPRAQAAGESALLSDLEPQPDNVVVFQRLFEDVSTAAPHVAVRHPATPASVASSVEVDVGQELQQDGAAYNCRI